MPYAQLLEYFVTGLKNKDMKKFAQLKEKSKCNVVHLIPPPPKESNEHILKHHEAHFSNNGILDFGVSDPIFRNKVWNIQVDALKIIADEWGFELIYPPPEAVNESGFLGVDYYANDATHANAEYGALIIKQLIKMGRMSEGLCSVKAALSIDPEHQDSLE